MSGQALAGWVLVGLVVAATVANIVGAWWTARAWRSVPSLAPGSPVDFRGQQFADIQRLYVESVTWGSDGRVDVALTDGSEWRADA